MKLKDLIAAFRDDVDDLKKPYLWSDSQVKRYANWAVNEACRRARLLVDSTTQEIVEITIAADEAVYDLDPRVLFVRRAKLASRTQPLSKYSYKDLDRSAPGWEDSEGDPSHYITDYDSGKLRLYPAPTVDDVLTLTVVRLPLQDMEADNAEPEIKPHLHEALLYGMKYRAYMKQDSETKDGDKAAENLVMFEAEFGKPSTAIDENWIHQNHGADTEEGLY